ncbi:MAG: extracellular solute-binding protein [Pseudomonadota bacterium]
MLTKLDGGSSRATRGKKALCQTRHRVLQGVLLGALCAAGALTIETTALAQEQTVRMWTFLSPGGQSGREVVLKTLIEEFEAKYPDVTVQVEQQVWNQMSPKFLAAHSAGSAPDIVWMHSEFIGPAIAAGALADLNAHSDMSTDDHADLSNSLYRAASVDGGQYAVGLSYNIMGLFARTDMFAEAGLDTANSVKTWDDLSKVGETLTVKNASGNTDRWGVCQHLGLGKASPGIVMASMLESDHKPFAEDGKADWVVPSAVQGVERAVSLIKDGFSPPDAVNWQDDDMYDQLFAGRCAIAAGASVRIPRAQDAVGPANVTLIPYPSVSGESPAPQFFTGWMPSVWSGSKNADAAAAFVAHMVSPEADAKWATIGGQIPVRASTAESLKDFLGKPENDYLLIAMNYIRDAGFIPPLNADIGGYVDDLNRAVQKVIITGTDPKTALQQAEKDYNRRHGHI